MKDYANKKGISIIGDIPIFVAPDSADVWANQKFFQLDEKGIPLKVAGVPPDYFSATGQLWGNPLYDWDAMKKDNYSWWVKRTKRMTELVDILRIDHFRGFDEYYSIPYGDKTAVNGKWVKGPDIALFKAIEAELGKDLPIIAEDLGFLTPAVYKMLKKSGYPGMKVAQFAFGDFGAVWQERFMESGRNISAYFDVLCAGNDLNVVSVCVASIHLADPEVIRIRVLFHSGDLSHDNVFDLLAEDLEALYLGAGDGQFIAIGLIVDPVGVDEIRKPISRKIHIVFPPYQNCSRTRSSFS